jgi:hypothetical protein
MIGIDSQCNGKPGPAERLAPAAPQTPTGRHDDIGDESRQHAAGDPPRNSFRGPGDFAAELQFGRQSPDQDARRRQFDRAVQPEGDQRDVIRVKSGNCVNVIYAATSMLDVAPRTIEEHE